MRSIDMYIPKQYGQSKVNKCPFCGSAAYCKNKQDVPVCKDHKDRQVQDMKCACGSWLDMKQGKYGVFYVCLHCGPINMRKALDMNTEGAGYKIQKPSSLQPHTETVSYKKPEIKQKKEITISSEELDFI
jgi:hypothetical protein